MAVNPQMLPQTLGLNSEPLREFRDDLDELIRTLVTNMTERNMGDGTITARIKVTMEQEDGLRYTQMKIEPDISLKIGAKGAKKCQAQEGIFLRYDAEGVPVIAGNQIGMDEYIRRRDAGEESA